MNKYVKRVRFETIEVGERCQTEYDANIMKTEEVRIHTEGEINFRNAVNLDNGKLISVADHQWVWAAE